MESKKNPHPPPRFIGDYRTRQPRCSTKKRTGQPELLQPPVSSNSRAGKNLILTAAPLASAGVGGKDVSTCEKDLYQTG